MLATVTLIAALLGVAHAADETSPFDPTYYADEWNGICATGMMQSPIDLPADFTQLPSVPENLVTDIAMPTCSNAVVKNVGSAIQVTWDPAQFNQADATMFPTVAAGGDRISAVLLNETVEPTLNLKMWPLQIHFHVPSEHGWDGMFTAAESHIVTAVAPGEAPADWGCDAVWEGGDPVLNKCIAVFGTKFRVGAKGSSPDFLGTMFPSVPLFAGAEKPYQDPMGFDLMSVIPQDTSYYAYVGSLTTPTCDEGLRWHVFNEHLIVSRDSMIQLESLLANTTNHVTGERQLYRHNNRPIQPLNGRTIWFHDAGAAEYQGFCGEITQTE